MNGWNHVLDGGGGETYALLGTRFKNFWAGGGETLQYEDVDDADDAEEQEENTDSLSESELPEDVECWNGVGE
jgi:hypothetical protein